MLNKWMELKNQEEEIKAKRVELEEQIFLKYGMDMNGKESITVKDDGFEISIKLNKVYKPTDGVELPESCYKPSLIQSEVKKYAVDNPDDVVVTINKPTIKVTRTK